MSPVAEGIFTSAWRCPNCGSVYTADVGECGQNQPFVCRVRVQRILEPTDAAIERACAAYDADWYEGKDHDPAGAGTWDLMQRVLRAAFDDDDSFVALLRVAELILDRHYPEAVFTATYDDGRDPGVQLVAALRAVARARADAERNRTAASGADDA